MSETILTAETIASPVGELLLVSQGMTLVAIDFDNRREHGSRQREQRFGPHRVAAEGGNEAVDVVLAYFSGDWNAGDAIAIDAGGTPFQQDVWSAMRRIPAGETMTYGRIAAMIGKPSASRAVGLAVGANPVAILLPCHRVVGSDGSLTGFAGGLDRKRWLLAHESASPPLFEKS